VIAVLITTLSGLVSAQSSGNFTYGTGVDASGNPITTACVLQQSGQINGGIQCQQTCVLNADGSTTCTPASGPTNSCIGNAFAGLKTNSGAGNVFVVRPSAVMTGSNLSSGQYGVTAHWQPSAGFGVSGIGEALACVGPVNLTVQQNKIFHFNSVNSF
jgi:hypothetical protein